MEKETNGKTFDTLTSEEKIEFKETYKNHPLFDFIDWEAFYHSKNGNAFDFVDCITKAKDEDGNEMLVLKKLTDNNEDYLLVYMLKDGNFYKIPDTLSVAE